MYRAANICIVQSGGVCTKIREILRITFNREKVYIIRESAKCSHRIMEKLDNSSGNSLHKNQGELAANICILQSGRFSTTIRKIFRITFNISREKVSVIREIAKFLHQSMKRLVHFQGTFCRIRQSLQLHLQLHVHEPCPTLNAARQ